jgi:hypothetical protein
VRPPDYNFAEIPSKIKDDRMYWPYFEGCIGAIDGTHIPAIVSTKDQIPYFRRVQDGSYMDRARNQIATRLMENRIV